MEDQAAEPRQGAFLYSGSSDGGRESLFFSTPELRQRLDLLRHLTDNSEKILLVKGPAGIGKSTLLQQYREEAREEWDLCCLQASSLLQPDQFYALLYRRYGITDTAERSVDHLIRRFEMLRAAGRLPVLVIDDADQLPAATVIAIFRLFERRTGARALIRVVLFAAPEIAVVFQTPQLQAMNLQSIQSLELPLLSPDQSQAFVHFLLETVLRQKSVTISQGRLGRLVKESAGLPGRLEDGLRQLFDGVPPTVPNVKPEAESGVSTRKPRRLWMLVDLPWPVLAGGVLLLLLLLLALLFQDEINRLFEGSGSTPEVVRKEQETTAKVLALPLEEVSDEASRTIPSEPAASSKDGAASPPDTIMRPALRVPQISLEPPESSIREEAAEPEVGPVTREEKTETLKAVLEEPFLAGLVVAQQAGESLQEESKEVEPTGLAEAVMEPDVQATPTPLGVDEEVASTVDKTVSEPRTLPTPSGAPEPAVEAAPSSIQNEGWLRDQNPGHYALQLVAVATEPAAKRFIGQHRLTGNVAYFRVRRDGKIWFSVVYGAYPDRAAAIRARARLPASLAGRDAWPRSFASIQDAMEK